MSSGGVSPGLLSHSAKPTGPSQFVVNCNTVVFVAFMNGDLKIARYFKPGQAESYGRIEDDRWGEECLLEGSWSWKTTTGSRSLPAMPYTKNAKGQGPAWANSLFEDNAEFGLGMFLGTKAVREALVTDVEAALAAGKGSAELKAAMTDWKDNLMEGEGTRERADKLAALLA